MKPPYLSKLARYLVATFIATAAGVVIYFLVRNALRVPLYPDDTSKRVEFQTLIIFYIVLGYLYAIVSAWPFVEITKRIAIKYTALGSSIWIYAGAIIGVLITLLFMLIFMLAYGDFGAPRIDDFIALFSNAVGGAVGGAIYVRLGAFGRRREI